MNIDNYNFERSFQTMPEHEPFICSFSGGKDSALALSIAVEKGDPKGILHWVDKEKKTSVFHAQNLSIIENQATCMQLPLYIAYNTPWKKSHLELLNFYREIKSKGISSIVFGDINIEDSAKMQYILCKSAGLIPRFPLWKRSYNELMIEIDKRNIKSIITRINTDKLDEKWLGQLYDQTVYQAFCTLPLDPFGEMGEFHTTVVDMDLFCTPLNYELKQEMKNIDNTGIYVSTHNNAVAIPRTIK